MLWSIVIIGLTVGLIGLAVISRADSTHLAVTMPPSDSSGVLVRGPEAGMREASGATSCALVIITSINDASNISVVRRNMEQFPADWECLWLTRSNRMDLTPTQCQVFRRPGTLWGEILYEAINTIESYACDTKFLLLDDVDMSRLNVRELRQWAHDKHVDVASPTVRGATYTWMFDGDGAAVPFVEIYATLLTLPAWRTLRWSLALLPHGVGWGYDICLARHLTAGVQRDQSVAHLGSRTLRQFAVRASLEMFLLQVLCTPFPGYGPILPDTQNKYHPIPIYTRL